MCKFTLGQYSVTSSNNLDGTLKNPNVRKIKDEISNDEVLNQIRTNNLDEVVIKDEKGARYIIYGDELDYKHGDIFKLAGANPNVVFIDNELNEDAVALYGNAEKPGTIAGPAMEKELESKLLKISDPVTDEVKNEILKNVK
jgi:hypothetical protein